MLAKLQVLEAITSSRCLESFSMEGLELLGDSFLKYAVSCRLFLLYEKKHEGQLSARRMRAICNATLHDLAVARGLPVCFSLPQPFAAWLHILLLAPKSCWLLLMVFLITICSSKELLSFCQIHRDTFRTSHSR